MSIALDPVLVDDIAAYSNGPTYQIPTKIQPDRLSGVRIFNNTPFDLLVNNVPGVNQVWLPPYTEDLYISNLDNPTSAFNSAMLGQITITPVNLALRNNDSATTPLGQYHPYRVLITVYEIGDSLPGGLPIVHLSMVSVVGEALTPTCIVSNTTFNGAAATITLSIPDVIAGTATIQYATVLAGFSVDLASAGTQHNNSITITNIAGQGTVTISIDVPNTTPPYVLFKNNLNWMSGGLGQGGGANVITINFPAITGVSGSLTGWAYAERVP